ncbi:WYL domain-containing protein [Streptomyces sp. BE133]|uniref:WYL domain-containing protein n=1 Tax=Streptomyces sp. BE133 TaxID=3002523 RepID=UPI002E776AC1|nr:WYL domain-containing protein [Streptomyces sp. BE133]MEE1812683.1 WYL domain-containing protein [Streptomyces sp. BE133]
MKNTKTQTTTRTLADLYRAMDRQNAVTITYFDEDGTESIRTIEPYDIRTTKSGLIQIRAMCRLRGEARSFYLHRIVSYTCHRISFVLDRPEATTPDRSGIVVRSMNAFIAYELERDTIAAAYRGRVGLAA